jgi:(2Fe-2S) ferredoxin
MQKPAHHIFVCASFRVAGEAKGVCHRKDSTSLLQYLQGELSDRDMSDVVVSTTGCLNLCEKGPIMVVYPENHWYGEVSEEKIDSILDALQEGQAAEGLLC